MERNHFNTVKSALFLYPELQAIIKNSSKKKEHCEAILKEMISDISPRVVRTMVSCLNPIFRRIYDGFEVQETPGSNISELIRNNQLVFVPNHQSHADYLVFNYILYKRFKCTPYTAGGINLNLFLIGKIFKNLGCIFIRRSFYKDQLYKVTLKAYLQYLMSEKKAALEFYYEGGRSRNGMLLKPKFGFFSMIINIFLKNPVNVPAESSRPLVFIPVSISHEFLPEQSSLASEVSGERKKKETFLQLLRASKLLNRKMGRVYINFGKGQFFHKSTSPERQQVQDMAFSCYRSVANGIPVTPVALCSLILLDGPTGGVTWSWIAEKSQELLAFCKMFNIPLARQLREESPLDFLRQASDFLIKKNCLYTNSPSKLGKTLYLVHDQKRRELAYFKNSILHHFFIPGLLFSLWEQIRLKNISNTAEMEAFVLKKRKQLKYDIYIPAIDDMWSLGVRMVDYFSSGTIKSFSDVFKLEVSEFEKIGVKISIYGNFFRYKYEAYYLSFLTYLSLGTSQFTALEYFGLSQEIFDLERLNGLVIKYSESYSLPMMKNSLNYALNIGILSISAKDPEKYLVNDLDNVKSLIIEYAENIASINQMNLRKSIQHVAAQ